MRFGPLFVHQTLVLAGPTDTKVSTTPSSDGLPNRPRVLLIVSMATDFICGIHHITAIASDPQRTLDFYTQVLGLRLVKLTVHFDDPATCHLYFGDEIGAPGTILTFFPWIDVPRGKAGPSRVVSIPSEVPIDSFGFWIRRLRGPGLSIGKIEERFCDPVIRFSDPDGLSLELVGLLRVGERRTCDACGVPREHALRGLHSATLSERRAASTESLLEVLGFTKLKHKGNRVRYRAGRSDASIVAILHATNPPSGTPGGGTVHHIAFRTPTDPQQAAWREELTSRGYDVTQIIDRVYFHSIDFQEPGGVLFEIATDPPGFLSTNRWNT
jgi:glyoxalase family protein